MIKVKDGYAKLIGTTYSGSADRLLLSNGGDKAVSDFAASSHKHSASDITSGTLSVARGGTGATSFTSGAALIGNGTGAVSTRSITSSATKDSTSLITSGGVYSALAGKMNASITSIELNTSGGLKSYGGFIDFHFHDSNGTPLNASGEVTSDGKTPDYTSRIIEDAAGTISVNGVKLKDNKVTASKGFVGNLTGNVTGNVSGSSGSCTGNAASATNADKLDNIDSTGFMRVISQNATWSSVENIPTNLTPGVHAIHISGKEYSSILAGNDYIGAQWQLYFHPHASYLGSIKYRYSGDNVWKTLLDSSNSSVSKNGQTLIVKINGSEQSLTNSTYNFSGVSFTSGNQNTGEHNCNNIKSNGVWYYTSNGPTTTLGATTNDGALYSQAYSTSWVAQIAQDYRNGNLFTRGLNSGSWSSWRKVAYVDDTVRNAYYMRTMESGNSNWYTGWKAWFKWIDGSILGLKITNANTDDNTDASSYKFKADLAGVADSATTATNLSNKPSLLISGNTIAVKAGEKTSDYITVPYATKAYIVSSYEVASSSNTKRRIWIDWTSKDGKAAYSDDLTYQTDIKTLFAPYLYGKITVPGGSYSWYQVQQYNSSDANPSYYDATCAIVNINSYTGWQPWIRGVDSEKGSWTIGQYTTNLHIGYIPKSNTTNGLTYSWTFGKDGSTIFPGAIKFNKILIPTSSGGTTYGAGTSGQVLKSNGTTVYWASDSNSNTWRAIQVNGTQIAATGTGTYAVNFKSGTGITVSGTAGSSSAANAVTITNAGVRATTINGNYLRVNTNGTNADLTIPYATSAGSATTASSANWLNTNSNLTYGASGLQYFNATLSTRGEANTNGTPTNDWYHIIRMNHANNGGYYVDLAACFHSSQLHYRRIANGTNFGWVRLLDYGMTSSPKAVSHTNWSGTDDRSSVIPTLNFLSYWNGAYNSSNSSNLTYCANGTILGSNNYTSYVNTTNFPGLNKTGTVTSVATGTGLTGGTITSSGTISINSTYQTYISNGNTAYGWGNHASAKYMKAVGRHSGSMNLNKVDSTMSVITEIRPSEITTTNLPSDYGTSYGCLISARDGNSTYGHGKMQILGCNKKFWMRATQGAGEENDGTWCRLALTSDLPTKTSQLTNDSGYITSYNNYYHTRVYSSGLKISTGTGVSNMYVPTGTTSSLGVVKQHTSTDCTSYTSDEGATTPAAVKKAVGLFAVTKVSTGKGLTGGDITTTGTIKCNLNSETSLGTLGTTSKLYAIGVDANGKLCVKVPWVQGLASESDPIFSASAAAGITATDIANWNSKTANTGTVTKVSTGTGLTGGNITSTGTISINSTYQTYISNGNTAYGWGNHANAGYIKSTSILKGWSDTRSAATKPNDYNGAFKVIGIKSAGTTLGLTSTQAGSYATIIGWRGWSDSSGGYAWEIASTDKNRLYVRSGSTTSWNNGWQAIAYTSDIPTKTSQLTNDSGYLTSLPSHNHDGRYAWGNYASQSELSDCNNVSSTGFWTHSGFTNRPTDVKDWGSLMNIRLYNSNNNYHRQLFFDCYGSDYVWTRSDVGGTWTSWKRLALASEIPSVGNGTVTINQAGASKGSFTLNQSTAATINLTDTNYYHTPSYSSGLSIASGTGVNAMYVPNAGALQSGVVSTGAQTFAGEKTFSSIRLRSTSTTNYGGYLYFGDGSYSYITEPSDDAMTIYSSKGVTISTSNSTTGTINLKSALSNRTSASTSYPGVVCDGMYLKSALYHIGSVYKLQSSTAISVSYGYGISGVTISSSKPREGKCTITVTNNSGFSIYVHTPHLVSLFTDAGGGSCFEHGFAYIQTGVTFPKSVSSGSTLSFSVIYGYMHTQRTWNTNDFTKSNDTGGFNCGVYVSRYV